jgi:hypothetical protein
MNRTPLLVLMTVVIAAVSALALTARPSPAPQAVEPLAAEAEPPAALASTEADPVARGEYLVTIMGCNDCHTPWAMTERGPEPDMTRRLSGHPQDLIMPEAPVLGEGPWLWVGAATNTAFAGPWGVSFAANLTPDPETGLGHWTADTFIAALRTGRHEGQGRPILPPMPWPMYRQATDDDLRAVFAYLQSLPPMSNRVPQPLDPPGAR